MDTQQNATETPSFTAESGEIYDTVYAYKDYASEAKKIDAIIRRRVKSGGNTLLEAACGTGSYLQCLQDRYDVSGFDISEGQVAWAQKKLPDAELFAADMADFDTGRQYDAVVCLFSSIGYLCTLPRLKSAIKSMARHTKPGGVVVVEPWFKSDAYITGHVSVETNTTGDLTVARMGTSARQDGLSVLKMHYMISRGGDVEHFVETHKLAMYTDDDFAEAFASAGLDVEVDRKGLIGRGLYIGTKPLSK